MKKLVAIAITMLVLGSAAPSSAQVFPVVGGGQLALASWLVREKGDLMLYFALAQRSVDDGGVVTFAAVGKGKCRKFKGDDFTMMMCSASGPGRDLPLDAFEFDPLLSSARLRFKIAGSTQTVAWRGEGRIPSLGAGAGAGDLGVIAGASLDREARANGRVLGRKVSAKQSDFSFLAQGAGAGAFVFVAEDGTVHLERTFRAR